MAHEGRLPFYLPAPYPEQHLPDFQGLAALVARIRGTRQQRPEPGAMSANLLPWNW